MKKLTEQIRKIENGFASVIIIALAAAPVLQIIARLLSRQAVPEYETLLRHLTLWIGLTSGMICTRENQHIKLGFDENLPDGHLKKAVNSAVRFTGASVSIGVAVAAVSFIIIGFSPDQRLWMIPVGIISCIIPVSFAFTGIRFFTASDKKQPILFTIAVLTGLFLALPSVLNLWYSTPFMPPEFLEVIQEGYYALFDKLDWLIVILIIVLTVFGLPIFVLLGGTAFILFAGSWSVPEVIPNEVYNLLTGSAIPAIPLFTLTGFILSEGKTGERLVNLFRAFIGRMPGGLAVMTVLVCAFFTTFTGASGVTILAMGGLLSFILIKSREYSEDFTKGLITSSGSIGLLFPPSLPIIMYGVQAQISIRDMFLAGIIPGVILVAALSVMAILHSRRYTKNNAEAAQAHHSIQEESRSISRLSALKGALGDLLLPVFILFCYFGGITTLVETGAVAVVYSFVLEFFIYRDLKVSNFNVIMKKSMPVIGGVLMILAMAKGLSYFIVDAEVPMMLTGFFSRHIQSPLVFLLLLNVVLLITGCLMDIFSAIMVVAPLIIPLGEMYGINPVQLGIIFLANLQLGYLTPPVGLNLFLASYAFETPLAKIYRGVIPFFLILLLMVLLITYVPWFSLALVPGV